MSIQIFLQGKLLGAESFLAALTQSGEPAGDAVVTGRAYWMTLLSEVLPRALLAELGLAKILLGASGGGSFFVVLPDEARPQAEAFLLAANADIDKLSAGHMRLIWGATENLGDWTIVRKRLTEEVWRREHTSPLASAEGAFSPGAAAERYPADEYFTELAATVPGAKLYGWSPELPGGILVDQGKHTWAAGANDGIGIAHHTALDEAGSRRATLEELSARAAGKPRWGVLRGEVDGLQVRLRRTQTIEEYIQLALTFKQFFAGELEVACMMGDFWRKVTVLHSGWGDFAAYGSWDALLQLGRELQRLFHRFAEANLKDLAGPEGKTITMALELAPEVSTPFAYVYEAATRSLATAKTTDRDCLYIFGRTVEWRHVNHASDLKELMLRLVFDLGSPPEFLEELSSFYREKPTGRSDRPWRSWST